MTAPDTTPDLNRGEAPAMDAKRSDAAADTKRAEPAATEGAAATDTRRYVVAIVAGLVVAAGALTAGLVLLARGSSLPVGTVVGGGARPAPQQAITAPPQASLAPESPPAVMGDHIAGDRMAAFYVRAADQHGDGRSVLVEDVNFASGSGWVVVHSYVGNAPGPILGVSSLQAAGDHANIIVPLKAPVSVSSYFFVMLHTEDNNDDTFDYPQSDQPAQLNEQIVMVPIYLEVGQ